MSPGGYLGGSTMVGPRSGWFSFSARRPRKGKTRWNDNVQNSAPIEVYSTLWLEQQRAHQKLKALCELIRLKAIDPAEARIELQKLRAQFNALDARVRADE